LPFELKRLGISFKQTGNGAVSVAAGKTGIYKLEGIPSGGSTMQDYEVVANFVNTAIPAFTATNGTIYSFTYNGSAVTKTGEQSIVFK
jgi:hypothetical protein